MNDDHNEARALIKRYQNWHDNLAYWEEQTDWRSLGISKEEEALDMILVLIQLGPMSDPANWPAHPNE
jgi:hypothetical protein